MKKRCRQCRKSFDTSEHPNSVTCSKECRKLYWSGKPKGVYNRPSSAKKMSEDDAAYMAGLFDGEGSIVLAQRERPGGGSLRITIANTHKPLIKEVIRITGCGTIVTHKMANPRHNTCYTWQVYGASARDLLQQMRPRLFAKAKRADAAIAKKPFEKKRNAPVGNTKS